MDGVEWKLTRVDTDKNSSEHQQFRWRGSDTRSWASSTKQREHLTYKRRTLPVEQTDKTTTIPRFQSHRRNRGRQGKYCKILWHLRCAVSGCIAVSRTNTRLGTLNFAVADVKIWNSLLADLHATPRTVIWTFRQKLKQYLFKCHIL